MKILVIGSGAREHALVWKMSQSPRVTKLFAAPGNAGTATQAENVTFPSYAGDEHSAIVQFAQAQAIDLVVVGPEAPLAAGLADALTAKGVRVFGPTRRAAEIESSKRFAKEFMQRHGIPTARFETFHEYAAALAYLEQVEHPVVLKASGLAAGKGVILPESPADARRALQQIMVGHEFGAAGDQVVIEERLQGEEVSVLAFTDGYTVKPMQPAQDHKRLLDGDSGPNTGGMGAYAPVKVAADFLDEVTRAVLQPAVDGLRAEGRPFVGVLYAGLMLTGAGLRVLEFNCRFGDPECEVILPLLDTDLVGVLDACVQGNLETCPLEWKRGAAACVVLASGGYPGKYATGVPIRGLAAVRPRNAAVFHAGTKTVDGTTVTTGGRVLTVTGWGETLHDALETAYAAIAPIEFDDMQYRRDIGYRALIQR